MTSVEAVLRPIALERARWIAPFVFASCFVALITSEPLGIPLATPVLIWNAVGLISMGALTVALLRRKVPARYGHVAGAALWIVAVGGTLMSEGFGHNHDLSLIAVLEAVAAAILLDTRWVVGLLFALGAVWFSLLEGPNQAMYAATMVGAQIFAVLFHLLQRNAFVRLEELRLDQSKLQDQLLHAQRMEAIGTLASGLAHDMNNVLAGITSYAELVREDPHAASARDDLDRLLAQAGRGAALTRGLLAFSRRTEIKKRVVGVPALVSEVISLLGRTLPKHVAVTAETIDARVDGDPGQLQQVLINLGVNAADALAGRDNARIMITCFERDAAPGLADGRYVEIRVTDNGTGMDEERRSRVFEPFFTTKPLGKGTGLGLSTAWGIAHGHGGTITVASTLGHGSSFSVFLPITEKTSRPIVRAATSEVAAKRSSVLVVDDEDAVRSTTMRLLQRRGFTVFGAANGEEALRVFADHPTDLVVLDMGMPVMGGRACFERLREVSQVPVLVASGYALEEEAREMIARGVAVIEKPFGADRLLREVNRLLA